MTRRAPRTCTRTGLRLLPCSGDVGHRIAKRNYPPVAAPTRSSAEEDGPVERSSWGRYDATGTETLYTAGERAGAFAEVLATFKVPLGTGSALEVDARALGLTLEEFLPHLLVGGWSAFTTAALRSEDRSLTTAAADLVHDATLDDGSHPVGIHFGSKHGGSWCRALWLDRTTELAVLSSEAIEPHDPDFRTVTRRFGLRAF